jgi:signal transduction histidine kinase
MAIFPLDHRAGRVIAASRIVLATLFLAATLVAPPALLGPAAPITALLSLYLVAAIGLAVATWDRWWLEYRLTLPAYLLDLAVVALVVLLTGGYMSAYFGFFFFLIIAATMRWRPRQAVIASLGVAFVLLASGWVGSLLDTQHDVDPLRLITRAASIAVLATMVLWLRFNRFASPPAPDGSKLLDSIVSAAPPAGECLAYAAECLGAGRAHLVWSEQDEPWLAIVTRDGGEIRSEKLGPEDFPNPFDHLPAETPFLFDCRGRRLLIDTPGGQRMTRNAEPFPAEFAIRYDIGEGLAVPIRTSRHEAVLIAQDIPGLCGDLLSVAVTVRDQIAAAFERAALLASKQAAHRAESRLALARNLHDGAIQFLAGLALKIRSVKGSDDPEEAQRCLDEIETELVRQQQDVRAIIDRLRRPGGGPIRVDLCRHLETLVPRLESRWGIKVETGEGEAGDPLEIKVTPSYRYQLEQMIGEAASNAVRHGSATRLRLAIASEADGIRLEIEDDGTGFPFTGLRTDADLWQRRLAPVSLHQRVRSLGGTLAIFSSRTGSILTLKLPVEERSQ